jgi:hypothetical protein
MNDQQIDQRLGALLRMAEPAPDPAFAERVLLLARLNAEMAKSRRRARRRAAIDCAAAAAVGLSFYFLSQTEHPAVADMISLQGPSMAGLVMLALWAIVALPNSPARRGSLLAS